jgi:hypothetical protein
LSDKKKAPKLIWGFFLIFHPDFNLMYKTLTTLFIALLFPILVFAQDDNVVKDFIEKATHITSLKINDHLNVLQVTHEDNNFDLIGVNDQMQVVWKSSLKGHPIKTAIFKGKIVTVASTEYDLTRSMNNTFNAFLTDPLNGNLLIQKQIYTSPDTYQEYPDVSTGDGAFFKFIIRQAAAKRIYVFGFLSVAAYDKLLNKTTDLEVLEFNDKLETTNDFKPQIAAGTYIKAVWNKYGDMYCAWLNGPTVEIYQYNESKTAPSNQLNIDVTFKEDDKFIPGNSILLTTDDNNRNALYYGLVYYDEDKEGTLGVGKFDFSNGKKSFITELLDKVHLKEIKKNFVVVNKKIDDPNLNTSDLAIRYLKVSADKVIATTSSIQEGNSSQGSWVKESSTLIYIYDVNLNLKYQQVFPAGYGYPNAILHSGYNVFNNKLNVVSNYKTGLATMNCLYGVLDLSTGNWDKMDILPKKKINNPILPARSDKKLQI